MTWWPPWVSRAWHEATIADHVALQDAWREAKLVAQNGEREANRRYDDLLAKYHTLKLHGAVEAPAVDPRVVAPPDPVARAIAIRARGSRELRMQMEAQAAEDRANGIADHVIERRILTGISGADLTEAGIMDL